MMRRKKLSLFVTINAALSFAMLVSSARAGETVVGKDDVHAGQQYFLRYCASCHGTDGSGNGPVAKSLAKPPANLRLLSESFGSPLPASKLADLIDGRDAVRAHGTSDMPVWGERLYAVGAGERGETGISDILRKIVAYLDTIQDRRRASR